MQPKHAGEEPTAEPVDAPAEPAVVPVPADSGAPALVLRPKLQWLAAGPGLILLALLLLGAGRLRAAPLALLLGALGAVFLRAWWDRVDVGETRITRRGWRHRRPIAVEHISGFGLRRVPVRLLRALPRGYRFGRFWSLPLTMRLLAGEETLLELRCAWWGNWRELTYFVISTVPGIELDGRTRGRIERYVGVPPPASPQR
jgi:hypothetical protein